MAHERAARPIHMQCPRPRNPLVWPIHVETAHNGEARARRQLHKNPLDLPVIHPEVCSTIPTVWT